jgi:hypothetical protein
MYYNNFIHSHAEKYPVTYSLGASRRLLYALNSCEASKLYWTQMTSALKLVTAAQQPGHRLTGHTFTL